MFRNLLFLLAIFASSMSFAQNAPNPCADIAEATRGKTSTQIDTILQSCRGESGLMTPTLTADNAQEWADIAQAFAKAAGTAAKELGVATNDFLDSPAGYLLAGVLIYNYGGGFILVGIPFALFTILLYLFIARAAYTAEITYTPVPVLWGFWTIRRKTRKYREYLGESRGGFLAIIGIALALLNVAVIVNVA